MPEVTCGASAGSRAASRRLLLNEFPDAIDCLLPLVEHRSEQVPHVDHVLRWLVGDRHAGLSRAFGQSEGIVEQRLGRADLNEKGWQPGEISVEWRRPRCARILAPH